MPVTPEVPDAAPQLSDEAIEAVESSTTSMSRGVDLPPEALAVEVALTVWLPIPSACMTHGVTVVVSVILTALHPRFETVPAGSSCVVQPVPVWQLVPAVATDRHSSHACVVTLPSPPFWLSPFAIVFDFVFPAPSEGQSPTFVPTVFGVAL